MVYNVVVWLVVHDLGLAGLEGRWWGSFLFKLAFITGNGILEPFAKFEGLRTQIHIDLS